MGKMEIKETGTKGKKGKQNSLRGVRVCLCGLALMVAVLVVDGNQFPRPCPGPVPAGPNIPMGQ